MTDRYNDLGQALNRLRAAADLLREASYDLTEGVDVGSAALAVGAAADHVLHLADLLESM